MMRGFVLLAAVWFAACTAWAADVPPLPYILADGQRGAGRLVGVDSQWRITLETDQGRREWPVEQLVRWGQWRERAAAMAIVLADGGVLHVEDCRWDDDRLVLPPTPTGIWQEAKLPRGAVRGLVFQWPASRIQRDRLVLRLATADPRQDEVWLDGGDRLQGTLRMSESPWSVRTRAGDVAVARERVAAVALRKITKPPDVRPVTPGAWVGLRDGSCLWVRRLVSRSGMVELELAEGLRLRTDEATLWPEIRSIQPLHGGVTYLSDLQPIGYKHVPFLSQAWDWVRDGSVAGGRLRSAGQAYRKGLGMHSSARLAYDLPGEYASLQAELAIDESAGRRGSVAYRVYVDRGDGQWKLSYESPVVRGGSEPVPLKVDLHGVQRLALIVDFADRGDELDHANWLDARLVR